MKFKDLFSKLNIQLIAKYNFTIKNTLINNAPQNVKGCVYKVNCNDCDIFYIGESGRGQTKT